MFSLVFGSILVSAVFALALYFEPFQIQLPLTSLIIVGGGTASVLWLSVPLTGLQSLFKSLVGLFFPEKDFSALKNDFEPLLKDRTLPRPSQNPLIQYAAELWAQGVAPDLFIALLSEKRKEVETRSIDAIQAFKNLAKYPPAFGMIGTVMGMVALFSQLDSNKSNIGVSLSLAMTSTLLGLVLTNVLISPLADRLQIKQVRDQRVQEGVYQVLLLINSGEPESLIQEEVNLRAA